MSMDIQSSSPSLGERRSLLGRVPVNRKATDTQILEAYATLKSVKKVGALLGMCGQSVHERLVKLGASNPTNVFTKADEDRLLKDYSRLADEGRVGELAKEMGRTRHYLARQARRLGITNPNRKRPYIVESISALKIEWFKNNPHPRGMLGKSHSDEFKNKQSQRSFDRWHSMSKDAQVKFSKN